MTARQTSTMGVSWKASVPMTGVPTWPVMATIGHGIELGVGEAGDEVGGAGAAGGDADADLAGGAGVALGREAAALLVPRQDGAQPVAGRG